MFDKILIANRGEIACRIIDTCRRLGVATVAVYSSADRNAMHVEIADEAVRIGAAPSSESYLNIDAVVGAALTSGAEAVHPGYGFLSENADFADACAAAGVTFIGPSAAAIRSMGSKSEAKRIMSKAGVPVLPGDTNANQDDAALQASAKEAGYPVMVKPAAGGGGRGMRIVRAESELDEALGSARREALSSFGDDSLLIEKYLEAPRHIEVQIFGDSHGNVVHLYERDCSAQRRHQKVVEEAPATGLSEEVRDNLYASAIKAAAAVDYTGAGTVEFLLGADELIWFMEMNTRLQVEHPVTEMVTGLDLVEWQLRVAAGEAIPLKQDDIKCDGHAIEARLYAEDAANDFAPGFGRLARLSLPATRPDCRIDTGVRQGDEVTVHYDPMIAKISVRGDNRMAACEDLSAALTDVQIAGPATNEAFLKALVDHPAFRSGAYDTGLIAREMHQLATTAAETPRHILAAAALAEMTRPSGKADSSPWGQASGWRLGGVTGRRIVLGDMSSPGGEGVVFEHRGEKLIGDGEICDVAGRWNADGLFDATVGGSALSVRVVRDGSELTAFCDGRRYRLRIEDPLASGRGTGADAGSLIARMPGVVVAVHVEEGAAVSAGTPLMAMEAMKVEHTIRAPADGIVIALHFAVGERVAEGSELLKFEAD